MGRTVSARSLRTPPGKENVLVNHIAMLLPKEDLVRQAREQARGHDSVAEIRCITTERAVEEAQA